MTGCNIITTKESSEFEEPGFLQKTVGYIMNKKHVWTTFLTLIAAVVTIIALGGMNVMAAETVAEGNFGDDVHWVLDSEGKLTVSGTGEMVIDPKEENWNANQSNVKSIVIESGVTNIASSAFCNCSQLENIEIPDTVTKIGSGALANCRNLESIDIPNSVTQIDTAAFSASGLIDVTLPNKLKVVANNLFAGCRSLESVYIPDSVESFGMAPFAGSTIKSVRLPDGLTVIPENLFNSSEIETIVFPSKVTVIGKSAFSGCTHIKSLVLPDGLKTIEDNAFYGCTRLESVVLPESLTYLGENVFYGCEKLGSVTIPGNVEAIKGFAFYDCRALRSVTIKEGKTASIEAYAFSGCKELRSVTIPSSVTFIAQDAFLGCQKTEVIYINVKPEDLTWLDTDMNDFKPDKGTICRVPKEYLDGYKAKFASGTGDVNVTFAADHDDMGLGDLLCGYSLSLEGDIGVKFYMRFNDPDALSDNAKMVFTISSVDGSQKRTQEVYVKQQPDASLPFASKDGEYYVFKCLVYSKEMTSTITAQVKDGEIQGKAYSYTVQDYAKYILVNPGKYPDEQAMIKAMLNYGATSQAYFNYNTQKPANSILDRDDQALQPLSPDDINVGDIEDKISISGTNIRIAKASLILNETISMKLYLTGVDENIVLDYDGTILTPVKDGEYDVVTIDGIKGQYVIFAFGIRVREGSKRLGVISYSPLYYCKNVLSRETDEVISYNLKKVVSDIYRYGKAAHEYARKTNQLGID